MLVLGKTNKIEVICPICKKRDIVGISPSGLNKKSHLTTISVHKGLICPHHFQFFIDNNFHIRGYQKVDLELNQENSKKLMNGVKAFKQSENKSEDLFENVILDGDSVKYQPLNSTQRIESNNSPKEKISKRNMMTSKEIYEEFWEFIDDTNKIFHKFSVKDNRRQKSHINPKLRECLTV